MAARFGDGIVSGVEQRLIVPNGDMVVVQPPGVMKGTPVSADAADFLAFLAALPDMFDAPPLSVVKRR